MAFVVFEGGEGTGKSTQISLLRDWLQSKGFESCVTREPGGTPLAEQIRDLFKAVHGHGDVPLPTTELLMVMAARAQHVRKVVEPALACGKWVLCDRFLDSSYVYQWIRAGVPKSHVDIVAEIALASVFPHLTVVLHLPAQEAQKRMHGRGNVDADRLDAEGAAIHQVIADGFLRLVNERVPWHAGKVPLRVLIDASGDAHSVHSRVRAAVASHLGVTL